LEILGEDNRQDPSLITGRYYYKIGYIALHQGQINEAMCASLSVIKLPS
jgi:hypothetical protein